MTWEGTGPELPISKPNQLERLELLDSDVLSAMTQEEADARIITAADALASHYYDELGNGFDECVEIVSMMMQASGGPIGGVFGGLMVARSDAEAERACRYYYPRSET